MPRLTRLELKALIAAAGNIDPSMFTDDTDPKESQQLLAAYYNGLEKLRNMLELRNQKKSN